MKVHKIRWCIVAFEVNLSKNTCKNLTSDTAWKSLVDSIAVQVPHWNRKAAKRCRPKNTWNTELEKGMCTTGFRYSCSQMADGRWGGSTKQSWAESCWSSDNADRSQWEIAIFATWGSETPKPIELKCGMIDYVQHTTPHAKIDIRRFRGIGWGQTRFPFDPNLPNALSFLNPR